MDESLQSFELALSGASMFAQKSGQGTAVVLLHAGVADSRMWQGQIEGLQSEHSVYAYDRRGFGRSQSEDVAYSDVDDLLQLLDHFDLHQVILVASSQGAAIAIDFTLAHSERVGKLVLMSAAISGAPSAPRFIASVQNKITALDSADDSADWPTVNQLEADLWLDGPTCESGRVDKPLRELFLQMNGLALEAAELTKQQPAQAGYPRLVELTLPVLVIYGDLDFDHIQQRSVYLGEVLTSARVEKISHAAHLLNMEYPERVNQLLLEFLR